MSGNFRNRLQVAVFLDDRDAISPSIIVRNFCRDFGPVGYQMRILQESTDGIILRGPDELYLSLTRFSQKADPDHVRGALASVFNLMQVPDAELRLQRHQSYYLIDVYHEAYGAVADEHETAQFLRSINVGPPGQSFEKFSRRVATAADFCRSLCKTQPASFVQWTQSNMLLPPDRLDKILETKSLFPLTIHPVLFMKESGAQASEDKVHIRTIGAADYVGREIYFPPGPVPWVEKLSAAFAFIQLSIGKNEYIIPDGENLGTDSGEFSYLVRHLQGSASPLPGGQAAYELELMFHKAHGYVNPKFQNGNTVAVGAKEITTFMGWKQPENEPEIRNLEKSERGLSRLGGRLEARSTDPNPRQVSDAIPRRPTVSFGRRKNTDIQ